MDARVMTAMRITDACRRLARRQFGIDDFDVD